MDNKTLSHNITTFSKLLVKLKKDSNHLTYVNKKMNIVAMLKGDIISVFFGLVTFSLFLHWRFRKAYEETNEIII